MTTRLISLAAVAQLVDMGIPAYQARAALKASKGDVGEAAEKVFGGKFDDLEDDEEDAIPVAGPSGTSSLTGPSDDVRISSHSSGSGRNPIDEDNEQDDKDPYQLEDEGEDEDLPISDGYADSATDHFDAEWDHDDSDPSSANDTGNTNDPYAGVEYKKDRVEETIEVEMKGEKGTMWVQGLELVYPEEGRSGELSSSSVKKARKVEKAFEVLSQSAWMSGCPERGEQGILFQVYHSLTEGNLSCHSCTKTWTRLPSDFFAYFPSTTSTGAYNVDFESYKAHIVSQMVKTCPEGHHTCYACGQKCSPDGSAVSDWWNEQNGLHGGAEVVQADSGSGKKGSWAERSTRGLDETPITPALTVVDDFEDRQSPSATPNIETNKGKGTVSTLKSAPDETDPRRTIPPPCLFHCSDVQGIIVGAGLIMAQKAYEISNETKHVEIKKSTTVPAKRGYGSDYEDKVAGTSRAGGFAKGTGYSGSATEDRSGMTAAAARRRAADHDLTNLLNSLSQFLPRPDRDGGCKPSDFAVDSSTIMHLRRRFNAIACTLFSDNSIMDMSDRSELHLELVNWLVTIAQTEALASMIAMPFMRAVKTERKATDAHGNTEIFVRYEASDSPREVLERVMIQCEHVLRAAGAHDGQDKRPKKKSKGAEGNETPKKLSEEVVLVDFCNKIVASLAKLDAALMRVKGAAFCKRMQDSFPRRAGSTATALAPNAGDSMERIKTAYVAWATEAIFDYCDMRSPADAEKFDHIFSKALIEMEGSTSTKRSITIAKEMAVLSQHLPVAWASTVFLRVDETRPDCMKLLMTGPEDSPYCNGAYVFDLACPSDYPARPPLCKIRSTSGGRMRFGPNLYAEGKVCLSLLGTWAGPGWISGRSTVLQVVLSILSLILGQENPIANEPGHESQIGSELSKRYNLNVRRMNVRVTMKEAIEDPSSPFKSVIHNHFKLKAREIRQQLDKWEKEDDGQALTGDSMSCRNGGHQAGSGPGADFKFDLDAVRAYLDDLEAGREIVKKVKNVGTAGAAPSPAALSPVHSP